MIEYYTIKLHSYTKLKEKNSIIQCIAIILYIHKYYSNIHISIKKLIVIFDIMQFLSLK